MTPQAVREMLATHLIRFAKDDIPVDKIKAYLNVFDVPADEQRAELAAIAELINDAQITITWR